MVVGGGLMMTSNGTLKECRKRRNMLLSHTSFLWMQAFLFFIKEISSESWNLFYILISFSFSIPTLHTYS